jgi:hypothetical protein
MNRKTIEQVYGRKGTPSVSTMITRKRVVGAMKMVNGDSKKAQANLDFSNPSKKVSRLKESTIKTYYAEYNSLSPSEKERFDKTPAARLAELIKNHKNRSVV